MKYLSLAKKKADKSDQYFRHCCVVWKGGRILGWGVNGHDYHAEANAISSCLSWSRAEFRDEACYRAKFLSIRVTRTGRLAMAKPCIECTRILRSYKMTGWYSTSEGKLETWK